MVFGRIVCHGTTGEHTAGSFPWLLGDDLFRSHGYSST
jgi:hypothetical protein